MSKITVSAELNTTKNITRKIEPLLKKIQEGIILNEEQYYNIMLCIVEAVNNAAEHGNKFKEDKQVYINIDADDDKIIISIKDEGEGYIPDVKKAFDRIESEENLYATRGRGIFLMHSLMSKVSYSIDNGTIVKMQLNLN